MKSTKYSASCAKIFGNIFSKETDQIIEKNIELSQADIAMGYDVYCSMALMNTILGLIGALILVLSVHIFIPSSYTMLFMVLVPVTVAVCIWATYRYLPTYYIKKRARNIDLVLPYATNFISSMAVAGVSPAEIFQSLSSIDVYGEIQKEAKRIAKDIVVMGTDSITALKNAIEISPSKKFRAFIQGMIGTIQSGSDLHIYLSTFAEKYMQDDLLERKKDLDMLSVIGEVFVISVIAFPIFLVIILTVMGFFGGSMKLSMTILLFFSFVILPVAYVGFYMLVKSTSLEEISKVKSVQNNNFKHRIKENRKPLFVLLLSVGLMALFYGIIYVLSYFGYLDPDMYFYFDSIFLGVLVVMGPVGFHRYLETKRRKQIQERLPEFLVEIGDALSTGMTIFEAIKTAEKGHYGELKPEIKNMKMQLSWNVSIKDVFTDFAVKMKSAIIRRIVVTINKGVMMGGSMPKIFKAAAGEINQVNRLEDQRKRDMSIYTIVILLCFFVFLAIIVILNRTVFMSFIDLQTDQMSQFAGILPMDLVDPLQLRYSLYSFVFVQSIGAGILAGFMMDGKLSSGVRYSCILGIISFFVFKFLF